MQMGTAPSNQSINQTHSLNQCSSFASSMLLRTPVPYFPYLPLHFRVPFSASQRIVTSPVNSSEAYLTLAEMLSPTTLYLCKRMQVSVTVSLSIDSSLEYVDGLFVRTSKSAALSFFIFHALPFLLLLASLVTRAKSFVMTCGCGTMKSCEKLALPVLQEGFHTMAFLICRAISARRSSTFLWRSWGSSSGALLLRIDDDNVDDFLMSSNCFWRSRTWAISSAWERWVRSLAV